MIANSAKMETDKSARLFDLLGQMEHLADKGEWLRTEQLAHQLKAAVLDVPKHERRGLVTAIGQSLERVRTMALSSRVEVTEKLSGIRRGRAANRAYGQPGRAESGAALR